MMKAKYFSPLILFLTSVIMVQGQVVKSEKSSIRLNTTPKKEVVRQADTQAPVIEIITPTIKEGEKLVLEEGRVDIIGLVKDNSGISSLMVQSKDVEWQSNGVFRTSVYLDEGDHLIPIIAIDSSGNHTKSELWVAYTPRVLTLAEKVSAESKYYALIIGIENYEDPNIMPLQNPIKDATKLYNILVNNYTFETQNVMLRTDATRESIIKSLDYLSDKITPEDNLLIFYAGHGHWDEDANIGYWLPSDAEKDNKADWFRNSTLVDYLKEVKSKHTLLITDACFGGSILKRDPFNDASKAIEKLYERRSRRAMTSGTFNEQVPDRSAFLQFLINRLGNNLEKYLSADELFNSLRTAVINNSEVVPQYDVIQNVGDEGGDFIFIRK
jgi:hypothetical protein